MALLKPAGHFQYLELQADGSFYLPKQHRRLLSSYTHPLTRPCIRDLAHSGDSRDKDRVDEVGGMEGGGSCLPGPKQWVEVAAVQNRLGLHGGQWGRRAASWRAPEVSAACSALWGQ